MNKQIIEIIDNQQDKNMVNKIIEMVSQFDTAATSIQIENFILNDIEYPTPYGKYVQTQHELSHRLNLLIDNYYQIKETELEIKKKEREINKTDDDLDKEILMLQKEKLELKLLNFTNEVKRILKETKIFYVFYKKHPEFQELSEERKFELEAENWAKKTLNMPDVFYQRYGKEYLYKALGKEAADEYLQIQRQAMGLLPRELLEVKKISN
jgi:hypothetical protein